jgi:hypothetical protein
MMHRLVPCLATLAILSLPACKRAKGNMNDPDGGGSDHGNSDYGNSPTPTPEQVCTRLSELAAIDLGGIDPQVQRETIVMCTEQMTGEQQMRGPENWDGVARCVVAAQTDADIDRCDQLYPPVGSAPPPATPASGVTREDEVCVLMLSTFAMELVTEAEAAGRAPPPLDEADIRAAHAECLTSLETARKDRTGADYDRLLGCLASADSSVAMDGCLTPP